MKIYLEVPKEAGGLGLPNFLPYYWEANIAKILHWKYECDNGEGGVWVRLELMSNPMPLLMLH